MARAVLLVLAHLCLCFFAAEPAAAHAQMVDTSPGAGASVNVPPAQVVLYLDMKPATLEGDPLRVYAPTGERVDLGDASVGGEGTALSVSLAARPLPRGEYHVIYQVISADTHLVAGSFSFRSQRGSEPGQANARAPVRALASTPPPLADGCADCSHWPWALTAAGGASALAGAAGLRCVSRRESDARVVPLRDWAAHRGNGWTPEERRR